MAEIKKEQTVLVKFNTSTAFMVTPAENVTWNAGEFNYPKKEVRYLNVNYGDVLEIPKELYDTIKNTVIRVPNGKRGNLAKAASNLQGFKAQELSQNTREEVLVCELVA